MLAGKGMQALRGIMETRDTKYEEQSDKYWKNKEMKAALATENGIMGLRQGKNEYRAKGKQLNP